MAFTGYLPLPFKPHCLPSLDLESRKVEYSVVRGEGRRYTYFRFRPDLTLEVVVPRGRNVDPERAIKEKLPWILKERERLARSRRVLGPENLMYAGQDLKVAYSQGPTDSLVPDLEARIIRVTSSSRSALKELVRRWFLKESSAYAARRVRELAPLLGVRPSRVDVREIGKWGYCTRGGRLSFSWQLVALPERLREYVILHELAHLAEFNHSRSFKRKLGSVCPDFRQREAELDLILPYDRLAPLPQT